MIFELGSDVATNVIHHGCVALLDVPSLDAAFAVSSSLGFTASRATMFFGGTVWWFVLAFFTSGSSPRSFSTALRSFESTAFGRVGLRKVGSIGPTSIGLMVLGLPVVANAGPFVAIAFADCATLSCSAFSSST